MKTLLVAIDGSEGAQHALKFAAQLARDTGSRLRVMHVLWPVRISPLVEPGLVARIEREDRAQALKLLDDRIQEAGVGDIAEGMLAVGGAAEEISGAADAVDAWLISVGTHGRGAAGRVVVGSVSDRLVRIANKPVLVVH